MPFKLPPLPYDENALDPHISADTLALHHGKHHAAYVKKLNELIKDTPHAEKPLEQIVKDTADRESDTAIFNNAGQAWNHDFFWHSMTPSGGGDPTGGAADIVRDLGGAKQFRDTFVQKGVGQFGSGWVWLVLDKGKPAIVSTSNAMTPIAKGQTPLLTCDVWEHAYYVDYQNRREEFLRAFVDHLINWEFVAKQLQKAA